MKRTRTRNLALGGLAGLSSLIPTGFQPQCATPPSTFTILGNINRMGNPDGDSYPILIFDEATGGSQTVYSTPYTGAWRARVGRFHYVDAQGIGLPCWSTRERVYAGTTTTYVPTLVMGC